MNIDKTHKVKRNVFNSFAYQVNHHKDILTSERDHHLLRAQHQESLYLEIEFVFLNLFALTVNVEDEGVGEDRGQEDIGLIIGWIDFPY